MTNSWLACQPHCGTSCRRQKRSSRKRIPGAKSAARCGSGAQTHPMGTPGHPPEQLSLAGIEDPPVPTDGLFFAVIPDPQAATRIERRALSFREELGLKGRPLAADHFHITLYFLGAHLGVPQGIVAKAGEAAASIRMAPFAVTFDCAKSFSGTGGNRPSRPLVLSSGKGLPELTAFQQALRMAIRKAG